MNGVETRSDEIERYLDGVRSALADLPDEVRNELLEDLPAHLAEVASEDQAALEVRLGSPASYAAELRSAAGLRPGPARPAGPPTLTLAQLRDWAGRADRRVGRVIGYRRLTEFLPLLVPAWWVVRGYVLDVMLIGATTGSPGVLPRVYGSALLSWVLLLAFVAGSVWFGRWTAGRRPFWQRIGLAGANVLLAIVALVVLAQFGDDVSYARQSNTPAPDYTYTPGGITDVIPVGPDGKALTGVTLLDQDGNELDLGDPFACHVKALDDPVYRYPLCLNPDVVLGATGSRPGATPGPTQVISPTVAPATPTASPRPSPAPPSAATVTASPGR